jgi:hypothetical protein
LKKDDKLQNYINIKEYIMTAKKTRTKSMDQLWNIDDEQLKTPEHDKMLLWLLKKDNLRKVIVSKNSEAQKWDWENVKIHAEEYIVSNSGFRIGAPDIIFVVPRYMCNNCNSTHKNMNNCPSCESEDIIRYHTDHQQHYSRYFIEIKPKIENFGATLRQLKLFISYGFDGRAYIFTEDLRYLEEFEDQGIQVISPPDRQSNL